MILPQNAVFLHRYEEEKDLQSGVTHLTTLEQDVSRNSRERSEEVSILSRVPDGEALRNIINKLSDERNLRDLHLKHHHMSTAQFEKRTTHSDICGKVFGLYQHVVKKNMSVLQFDEAESRVSGLRPEEFEDLIFLDHITLTKEEVRIRRDKEKKVPGTWTLCNDKEELGQ